MSDTTTDTNPYQQWLKRILRVMKQQSASGWITVRATDDFYDSDDDMSDDDGELVGEKVTQQEVNYIRCIIMTPEREKAIDEMTQLILGSNLGKKTKMICPSKFADKVLKAFHAMQTQFKNYRYWSKKLNILLGFTIAINRYDCWLDCEQEGKMDDMVSGLFDMWKKILHRSEDDLGIDSSFTRPGLDHLVFTLFDKINPFEDWTL